MVLRQVVLPLGLGYGLLVLLMFFTQERLVFLPFGEVEGSPAQIGLAYEELWLDTADGERLHGWFVPHPEPRAALLFFHGNAGNISHRLDSLRIFHHLGLSVLIIDYRGYGLSSGRPSEQGVYRDAEAALAWLQGRDSTGQLVYFGRSLGAAVAAWLAVEHPPAALIMESSFSSLPELGAELYPWVPVRWLARMQFDSAARLGGVNAPLLLVHSREDEIIPFHHSERLLASHGQAQLLVIHGDHNRGFLHSGRHYVDGLDGFLDAHLTRQ